MPTATARENADTPAALRELADLPSPRAWPLVGSMLAIEASQIHRSVERWCRELGPLFRLRLGRATFLVVADHEAVNAILRDRPDGFRRSPRVESTAAEMGLDGPGVFNAEGDAWRNQRRMVMASFAPNHVRAYLPQLAKVARRLEARWREAARSGAEIDLQADLMRFTVDTIAGLAFGTDIRTLESDDDVIQRHLDKIFPALARRIVALWPYWRHVKLPADRELDRSVAALREATQGFIASARQRLRDEPLRRERPANLLEAMLVAADEPASGVDDHDVAGNVLTMLLAGEDTTANSLAWMIDLLYRHPEALQRAIAEVRNCGTDPAELTLAQLDSLTYLDACTHETMRLKPVAPFMVMQALRDTVVSGVRVPARTLIWCVLRRDSVDARHFPNPDAFEPNRWLASEDGPAASHSAPKRIAMPFGAGPRVCPGRYLAMLEIRIAMAVLLGRFEIESVTTPDGGAPRELLAFTMAPVGLRMRLRERR